MHVVTLRDAEGNDGSVVPKGTTGSLCGDGYTEENLDWVCVDFGTTVCDFLMRDLRIVEDYEADFEKITEALATLPANQLQADALRALRDIRVVLGQL